MFFISPLGCGYSLESLCWGNSHEYTQHTFLWRNVENCWWEYSSNIFLTCLSAYLPCSKPVAQVLISLVIIICMSSLSGESGLGKSTLINSLFLTDLYSAEYPGPSHRIQKTVKVSAHPWVFLSLVLILVNDRLSVLDLHWAWTFEPPYVKTNKMSVRPAKTRITMGIRPVWSETWLCAHWVAKDPSFLHAYSKDSDETGQMPRLIWVFAGCTLILLVLSCRGSFVIVNRENVLLALTWRRKKILSHTALS